MEDRFTTCGQRFVRRTLDGCPVEMETRAEPMTYHGKPVSAVVVTWKGVHALDDGQTVRRVTRSVTRDCGPKLGLSLTYIVEPECAETERRENRKALKAVMERLRVGYTLRNAQ